MITQIRRIVIAGLVFLLQWLVLGRLSVWGSRPDVVLLFVAWLALRDGRRSGAIGGFTLGACMDAVYGTWGIHMLVKTFVGFLLGSFAVDRREPLFIQPQQAFLGGLVVALLHNGLLVALLALQTRASNDFMIFSLWLGAAAYTAVVAMIAALFNTR